MENLRKKNSIKNFLFGFGTQIIQTIFPFITRTIFIKTLGESYLGVSSLFTSILTVLSLAELGLGDILIYSLYKPIAEKNKERIASLLDFYKVVYQIIAGIVFIVGLLLVPILPLLINLPSDIPNITFYYIIYVLNSALSYLFVYKTSIIRADQKQYIINIYTAIFTVILNVVQIIVLLIANNFTLYLVVQLCCTFTQNYLLSKKVDSIYDLKIKHPKISYKEQKRIFSDTKYMLMYRLGGTFLNSTDSIYISTLIGTVTVGYYINYNSLISLLESFVRILNSSVTASVGNINAVESKEFQKKVFDVLILIFFWIATIGIIGYSTLADSIIILWLGEAFRIDYFSILALGVRFYMPIILFPIWIYRNTTGLFKETKGILLYAGILNLILSYIFGKWLGLAGILIATSVSRLCTSFWYEPYILYKKEFYDYHLREYFLKAGYSFILGGVGIICVDSICCMINNMALKIIISVVFSILIPTVGFVIGFYRSDEFQYLVNQLRKIIETLIFKIDKFVITIKKGK